MGELIREKEKDEEKLLTR